ncbi:hypothetical protein [Thioclava sp. GXIMD4216]|uniref:Uncharacterized protein n=1 Tax=Thioclava litoralis TaxID=3076557 RepID=A0ABZ1E0B7_9RHOB|nr:hypothetical protein RPE78_10690 [Thioclava sp. FTW29]
MPLPTFLLLILAVLVAAGATLWFAISAGIPAPAVALVLLGCVGVARLMERIE